MAEVLPGSFPSALTATALKLPQREEVVPETEQLSGPYGPRFVGFGPMPEPTLVQKLLPAAIGLAGGLVALAFAVASGRMHL